MFSCLKRVGHKLLVVQGPIRQPLRQVQYRHFSGVDGFNENKNDNRTTGPITYASLGVTALLGVGALIFYQMEKDKKIDSINSGKVINVGKPALGGPWVLVDQDGVVRSSEEFKDGFTLLYFGFTHCPDICPSELVKVGKIQQELARRGHPANTITPIFITVDPVRDSIKSLKVYSQDFHPSIQYFTGTPEQISKVAKSYRVYFSKADEVTDENGDEEYLVDHSIVLYLVSPSGEFLDFFTQRTQVGEVISKIEGHIADINGSKNKSKA